jgi:signal transduction histidine kinase/ligand-binding sensor domain-containing protein/DNA-binding response OmpR family regulator
MYGLHGFSTLQVRYYLNTMQLKAILLLVYTFITPVLWAQPVSPSAAPTLYFDHLGVKEGLSQSTVYSIYQDSRGFIWLGTRDGLNRYDGYSFRIFRHEPDDAHSLGGNIINGISEDPDGTIWVATDQGISAYYPDTDSFDNYFLPEEFREEVEIRTLFADSEGRIWSTCRWGVFVWEKGLSTLVPAAERFPFLREATTHSATSLYRHDSTTFWIGTYRHGLYQADLHRQQTVHYPAGRFGNGKIDAITADQAGNLWVGVSDKGVYCLSPAGEIIRHLTDKGPDSLRLTHTNIRDVTVDPAGNVWVGTFGGLSIIDPATWQVRRVYAQPGNGSGLSHNSVRALYRDRKGSIWIGTYFGGVNIFDTDNLRFSHYFHVPGQPGSLSYNVVGAFTEDAAGNLIIGTEGGGLDVYHPATNAHTHLRFSPTDPQTISGNTVKSLYRDRKDRIWAGVFRGGLNRIDPDKGRAERFPRPEDARYPQLSTVIVNCIVEDNRGFLWLGTDTEGGLQKFDPAQERFVTYPYADTLAALLENKPVKWIWPDKLGNLWLATHARGLVVFNEATGIAGHFRKLDSPESLPENDLNCVYGDPQGMIWIATQGAGITRFNPLTQRFTTWTTRNGLPNNIVYGILEESPDYLWVSTLNGLSRFDKRREEFKSYSYGSGMPLEETNEGAFFRMADGTLAIGGRNGYIRFLPAALPDNSFIPPVHITSLRISNAEVKPGDRTGVLEKSIINTRQLTLQYYHSVVSFDFAALSFLRPQNNQYAYWLDGFDEDWTYSGSTRTATYTNLPDGHYIFRVKGSNNDGVWNEQATELHIRVLPPPWRTWWAFGLYALAIASGFFIIRYNALKSAQLKHELRLEQFETEKWKEIHQLKLDYFTDVSHEIRTPLTLIYNPLQKSLQSGEGSPWLRKQLTIMYANCSRLLMLVDQILEIRQLESGSLPLEQTPARISEVVENVVHSFKGLADQRGIELAYIHPADAPVCAVDVDKVEKIFYNLLSNAFKFTDEGGLIHIRSRYRHRGDTVYYVFQVYDTGRGIAPDQLDKIFGRFYKEHKQSAGSGIGLAHTQSLVERFGGRISVRSQPHQGTCFTLRIPFTLSEEKAVLPVRPLLPVFGKMTREAITGNEPVHPKSATVLLAEDNDELREYLTDQLSEHVQVIAVDSAEKALQILTHSPVQLVISDIMMGEISGLDLCTRIKEDIRLCHIPVILLTARSTDLDRIGGYRTGADDYITKPFITDELLARMNSILANRQRIQQLYQRQTRLEPREISPTSVDEKLLRKITAFLETHISENELSVEGLGAEVGLSRVHLYRKIKALTGLSPSDFIRDFRLKRAAQLLRTQKLKVAEVAYQVGFTDVHYFSKCFKKAYGMSPTAFAETRGEKLVE